ncbi:hypothetical protein D2V17_00470 [Aurantiacibacter xanthus]|uniref:DUF2059 domain-containing protein n=1 Tax=Aurantiacibacter xanthus TaxID=1784712 RepID=A0A3A1PHU3_9SPHN|nr:hypothetical protein [Aurantiacibacter xanthus]RIV93382.1 hypothetical protein D2V17_00470 [Aurantiacibacter xanthus]
MKRFSLLVAALAAAAMPAPAFAQADSADVDAETMELIGAIFQPPPLTQAEEARLPAATALIDKIVPNGTMGEMMGGMFEGFLRPMMSMGEGEQMPPLADLLGVTSEQLASVNSETAARAVAILDPEWELRREREIDAVPRAMSAMMTALEPTLKAALAEVYAVSFDTEQLTDIDAFFSTESGAIYARKSFTMASDPRYLGAMMQAMPQILGGMADMEAVLTAATADLATPRSWEELEPAEQDKLLGVLGMSREELEANMSSVDAEEVHDH